MLTHGFYPDIGGLEIAVQNFAWVLAEHGHEVHVLVPLKPGLAKEEELLGFHVHRFPFDWVEAEAALLQNSGVTAFRSKTTQNIQSILDTLGHQPIVHAHGEAIVAGGWLKMQNDALKLIYTPHASPEGLKELFQAKLFSLHFRPALEKTDIIAYQLMNLIANVKQFVDPSKIREIINFIDPALFNPSNSDLLSSRLSLHLPKDSKILFSPSRVDEEKGLIELVSALPSVFKKFPDAYLYIAGDLSEGFMMDPALVQRKVLRKVKKFIPQDSDRVRFTGALSYRDMPKWYCASDVIVLISRDECLPMCLLEAMAMEKPIVATDVGGIPELLKNTPGQLIETNPNGIAPPEAVANAILQELAPTKNKGTFLKLSREKILNQFSPEVGYQKLKAIYSEVGSTL